MVSPRDCGEETTGRCQTRNSASCCFDARNSISSELSCARASLSTSSLKVSDAVTRPNSDRTCHAPPDRAWEGGAQDGSRRAAHDLHAAAPPTAPTTTWPGRGAGKKGREAEPLEPRASRRHHTRPAAWCIVALPPRLLELRAQLALVSLVARRVDLLELVEVHLRRVQLVDVHDDLLVLELLGEDLVERLLVRRDLVGEVALGVMLLVVEQVRLP